MEELILDKMVWDQPSGHNRKNAKVGKRSTGLKEELFPGIFIFAAALVIGAMLALYGSERIVHGEPLFLPGSLPLTSGQMASCRVQAPDSRENLSLGLQIGDAVGAEYGLIAHGGTNTFFLDTGSENGVHLLILSNETGGCGYWSPKPFLTPWEETGRDRIEQALEAFLITVPPSAKFTSDADGWHTFTVDCCREGDTITYGTLRCRYAKDGTIRRLQNDLVTYTVSTEE